MNKLKFCPLCGSRRIVLDGKRKKIQCQQCGCSSGEFERLELAILSWNTRCTQQYYTIEDFGKLLTLSRPSVCRRLRSGDIPHIRVGRRVLIPAGYVEAMTQKAILEAAHG